MRVLFLVLAVSFFAATGARSAEPGEKEGAGSSLATLRAEYEKRQAEALLPVNEWYRGQLRELAENSPGEKAEIEAALAELLRERWAREQPELRRALLQPGWVWRSASHPEPVAVSFSPDGRVEHLGLSGTWSITGPSEVTVKPAQEAPLVLRFSFSGRSYVGDRGGVEGERLPEGSSE